MKPGLYVVMGVAGSGKSTIGAAFARALGLSFVEGDDFHPAENVERMALGIPLTDADRLPWLRILAAHIGEAKKSGTGFVMSCSALKRSYRDILRSEAAELRFIFLKGEPNLIAERLRGRRGHFMPAALLDSQFQTLEEPTPDEKAWVCDVTQPAEDLVAALVDRATHDA